MPRTSTYQDTYPEELLKMMSEGKVNAQIYAKWGIHKDTFYTWVNTYEDLKEAYEVGKAASEAFWVDKLMQGAEGKIRGFNFNAIIALMNNKHGWTKGTGDGGNTTNINIDTINIQHQNKDQLIEYIKTMTLKHQDVIDIELIEDAQLEDHSDVGQDRPTESE